MKTELRQVAKLLPPGGLLRLAEALQHDLEAKIGRDGGTRAEIAAANVGRKAIAAHKAQGVAR